MKIKSVDDYLIFIDRMILRSIDKHDGIEILEDLRYYIMWKYVNKYDEEMVNVVAILSQINLMIEKFCLNKECASNPLYHDLRKHILTWLKESNTKPEVHNHMLPNYMTT